MADIQTMANQIASSNTIVCNSGADFHLTDPAQLPTVPTKIPCNLIIDTSDPITLSGNLWVTGNISFPHPNTTIWLPTTANGHSSFIISGDPFTSSPAGVVSISNNVTIKGSDHGNPASPQDFIFFMSMSSNNTISPLSFAISGSNNSLAAVYYAPNGLIEVQNNGTLNNTTAKQVHLNNNAVLNYSTGLSQFFFTPNQKSPPTSVPNTWQEL